MKTVISANVPVSLAIRLKDKTKGTRSRVIARALEAYLDEKDAFTIEEISTEQLLLELSYRGEISKTHRAYLLELFRELRG
jgi:metal-responsive CopG/Arc/MetJ family transcriptional regulator